MGILAGIVTGSLVFIINYDHGFLPAFHSFLKQFAFNLVMAGFNTRTCEKLAKKINHRTLNLTLSTIIPTLQAYIVLFAVHYFGGTPKPGASTWWQVVGNLIIFLLLTVYYRASIVEDEKKSKLYKLHLFINDNRLTRLTSRKRAI